MREDGTFDVDANTSIDQLSDDLNVKIPEVNFPFSYAITNNGLKIYLLPKGITMLDFIN